MRFNAVFPPPHQSQAAAGHNQPCGLKIPEGHEGNSSAQYLFNNRWVWVDLEEPIPPEVAQGKWEYNPQCLRIFKYDVVEDDWAEPCARWCNEQWGSFSFNQRCAFGLMPHENEKDMPVLRACQKAVIAYWVPLTDWSCVFISGCYLVISVARGYRSFLEEGFADPPIFEDGDDGDRKRTHGVNTDGVTAILKSNITFAIRQSTLLLQRHH